MELSTDTIYRFLSERHDEWESCSEYGEPGYQDSRTTLVVLGDYWCRCGKNPHTGQRKSWGRDGETVAPTDLHDYASHHPRMWAALESQGVQFEWCDEWTIDYDYDKAYRTQGDSYHWQPTAIYTDDGDLMTPDDDIEVWIEWCADEPTRCLPSRVYSASDLEAVGFESYNGIYENGWHPGQTDDPNKITDTIRREYPDHTIVFVLAESSQFYIRFTAYVRAPQEDDG
jgi:hypothetical protein